MNHVVHWLAFGIAGAVLALPAQAGWTARPYVDGQGRAYFIAGNSADKNDIELFCSQDGTVNLSLTWPDRQHRYAADDGEPALMRIDIDNNDGFEANSYYWASGKGRLILDYGYPPEVRDIVKAIGRAQSKIAISVGDSYNDIHKTVNFDTEGALKAAVAFLQWCPAAPAE